MSEYNKELPAELRKATSTAAAEAHRDLHHPIAGPSSGTSGAFRTATAPGPTNSTLQSDFDAFAKGTDAGGGTFQKLAEAGATLEYGARSSRASELAATSWTAEDLQPRSADGADVLRWLDQGDSAQEDTLEQAMRDVQDRQEQEWKVQADSVIPSDPAAAEQYYPYLERLIALPEDQSITAYLANSSYSDDVWGLPMTLKQDLDRVRSVDSQDDAARERAVRRLDLLRRHLQGKAESARRAGAPKPSFSTDDWSEIWKASIG